MNTQVSATSMASASAGARQYLPLHTLQHRPLGDLVRVCPGADFRALVLDEQPARAPCSLQMGIAIIVCLSYNMLLGQGGMLSFGHAVYSGMGSFLAIHTLNRVIDGVWPLPVSLVPVAGWAGCGVGGGVVGLGHHQEGRHAVCHDHPGHR